ncbi:MAG TPA: redoxin domain-containing protein [Campylobacterales bacterium]|nr:redoxin domain-containing protein [Campylobacterales bacterium]
MKKFITAILLASLFQGCGSSRSDEIGKEEEKQEEKDIPKNFVSKKEYQLRGVEGETLTIVKEGNSFILQNSSTPLVLLDFFSTWCPACRGVAPHLANLQEKYPKELKVIGILIEENKRDDEVAQFKEKYGAHYTISNSTSAKENYANFKLSNEMASLLRLPRSFPIPLLVMLKDGKYFAHYIGAVPEEMIESDIKEALNLRGDK